MIIYIFCGAVSLVSYSGYLLISRYFGWHNTTLDWVFLILSVLSVLLWPKVRVGNYSHLALLIVFLLLFLYVWTFWFLALVFQEGI